MYMYLQCFTKHSITYHHLIISTSSGHHYRSHTIYKHVYMCNSIGRVKTIKTILFPLLTRVNIVIRPVS